MFAHRGVDLEVSRSQCTVQFEPGAKLSGCLNVTIQCYNCSIMLAGLGAVEAFFMQIWSRSQKTHLIGTSVYKQSLLEHFYTPYWNIHLNISCWDIFRHSILEHIFKHSLMGYISTLRIGTYIQTFLVGTYFDIPYWNIYSNIPWWDIFQPSILEHVFKHSLMGHISTLHNWTCIKNIP